jgi:two-component system LytT family response regulator
VFLDIQMPPFDGFELLEQLEPSERPHVVFVTAYDHHAVRAFEVSAVDYLMKPYSDARFADALEKAKRAVQQYAGGALTQRVEELLNYVRHIEGTEPDSPVGTSTSSEVPPEYAERIVLKADGALHFIRVSEVVWIEAQGDFVKVQTSTKTQLVRETLQSIEQKLEATKFLRIHRSYIVNLEHVGRVETALYGDYSVYMSDGTKLRLSRNYRSKLKELINQASLGAGRSVRSMA